MSAARGAETATSSRRFSKRVPATSASPTYKLTLPAEIVLGTLGHLVDRDFQLTDATTRQQWPVSIQPRKNKDKFEYTLQGWRAFAEERNVRTGDLLDFSLEGSDQLQVNVTKRPEPQATRRSWPRGIDAAEPFDEEQQLHKVSLLLAEEASDSKTQGASESELQHAQRAAHAVRGGNELNKEQPLPSRHLQSRASGLPGEGLATPRQSDNAQGQLQPFLRSGDLAAYMPCSAGLPVASPWPLQDSLRKRRIGEVLPAVTPDAPLEYEALDREQEDELLNQLNFDSPGLAASPMLATPVQRPPDSLLPTSPLAPIRSAERPRDGQRSVLSRPQSTEELQAALDIARIRANRAEAEATALARALCSMRGEVQQATTHCVRLARALCSAASGLPLVGTSAAAAAGVDARLLREQLQHYANSITDTLWNLQHLTQERILYEGL